MPTPALLTTTLATLIDGLLAGMFICSSMVEHSTRSLSPGAWIAYKHGKEEVFGPIMPIAFQVGLVATIAAAIAAPAHAPLAVAAALLAIVLAITVVVHLPLNKLFQTWTPNAYPVTWTSGQTRWRRWNLVRTVLVVAAYGFVMLGRG